MIKSRADIFFMWLMVRRTLPAMAVEPLSFTKILFTVLRTTSIVK